MVAAGAVEDVARTSLPAELFHRKRPIEGTRCPHIGKLPGGVLSTESAIFRPSALERVTAALVKGGEGYTWERAADLLGVTVAEIQSSISAGQLRLVDTFVTDRSFEEFCKKHGDRINMTLIDPATAKWLVSEYGVSQSATNGMTVSRVQKHALVIRACHCGRKIAGNAYFRHVRTCQSVAAASAQSPNQVFEGPILGVVGALGRAIS